MNAKMVLFLLTGALVGAAAAQEEMGLRERLARFDQVDRNGDGEVTPRELTRPEHFRRLDQNGDGVIERTEVVDARLAPQRRSAGTGNLQMPEELPHAKHVDFRYDDIEGVDPNLLSLDLYVPKADNDAKKAPVMIMIHGGGWRRGDKASPPIVGAKMRRFVGAGYIYASINYRLSPGASGDSGLNYPAHAQDCAKAITWLHDRIAEYGGDPDQLHLMGHPRSWTDQFPHRHAR